MIDTPRCNGLESNPLDSFDYRAWVTLAKQLERDLETCRDAHMANCLAADTLRTEIRTLREDAARPEGGAYNAGLESAAKVLESAVGATHEAMAKEIRALKLPPMTNNGGDKK